MSALKVSIGQSVNELLTNVTGKFIGQIN